MVIDKLIMDTKKLSVANIVKDYSNKVYLSNGI